MKKIVIHYDKEGDILEITLGRLVESVGREVDDDVFEHRDKEGNIVGLTVINFKKRLLKGKSLDMELPVNLPI
ncbi:MAG TPA: DUF2283 domain-containing protein [Candidatus Nanoarchaeia archaeon]|nr:DUF2283 domain-containing protein [Candidatus Nanoarchaeia archaeon]